MEIENTTSEVFNEFKWAWHHPKHVLSKQ